VADFIPAVNTAKVAIEGLWSNQKVVTTLWFTMASEPDQADLEALADDIGENWVNAMLLTWADTYSVQRITATRQNSANDIQGVVDYTDAPVVGTGEGDSLPLNCAWSFSFRTLLRGRSFRGRNFLPGFLNSILDSPGIGNAVTLAGVVAAYALHLITDPPAGWVWVVASHFADHEPRATAVLTPIVEVIVDTWLDSQRRRLVGRGS
jgi:hypothetical protein